MGQQGRSAAGGRGGTLYALAKTFSQTTCTEDERAVDPLPLEAWRCGGVGRKKQKQNRDCHFNEAKLFFMTKQPRAVLRLISPAGGKADNGDRDRNTVVWVKRGGRWGQRVMAAWTT